MLVCDSVIFFFVRKWSTNRIDRIIRCIVCCMDSCSGERRDVCFIYWLELIWSWRLVILLIQRWRNWILWQGFEFVRQATGYSCCYGLIWIILIWSWKCYFICWSSFLLRCLWITMKKFNFFRILRLIIVLITS